MPDETPVLTNDAAATRLRELLLQLVEDEPPPGPPPEEHFLLPDAPCEGRP